jgi:hypothetical protein
VGAKFGVGRCGGIEKTSLISLTSEERRTRPHMRATITPPGLWPKRLAIAPVAVLAENAWRRDQAEREPPCSSPSPRTPLNAERQAVEFGIERSASTVEWSGFRGEYSSAFDTTA